MSTDVNGAGGPVRAGFEVAEVVRRAGHARWTETRLFEVLGSWVATIPELDAKIAVGAHCHHHAWHADLWRDRMPELAEMDPDTLTVPANDSMARFMDEMAEPSGADSTIEKLVGPYRILIPRCVAAYEFWLSRTDVDIDAPTARTLKLVLADHVDHWREGERLLQSVLTTPDDARRAADHQAVLEAIMVAAGGAFGPGSID